MHHVGRPLVRKHLLQRLRRPDVDQVEARRRVQVLTLAGVQVVHHRHTVAGLEQCIDDVRADEAGPAGYQDRFSHACLVLS